MKALVKSAFSIGGAVVLLFVVLAVIVARSTAEILLSEAERTVRSVVAETTGRINCQMAAVEAATRNSAWVVGEHLDDPDYMYRITRKLVENNDFIVGSAVAFEPNFFRAKGRLYSPYSCVTTNGEVKCFSLPYDYPACEWYRGTKDAGQARWCEPYFDEGGAGIMMCTFSVPIRDAKDRIYAVLTADISLERLANHVASICPYPQSYAMMISGKGEYIVKPPQGRVVERDNETITIRDQTENGWSVAVVCPVEDILSGARGLMIRIVVFAALGLVLIVLVSWVYSSRLQRATAQRERIASELSAARVIQSGFLQKDFPEEVHAVLRPAREVGGDLYDFVREGDRLYFIISDASGKGVPAALFSFVAVTVFRTSCRMGLDPAEVVGRINEALAQNNATSMFVRVFAGLLDLGTGELSYACAGHNPPVIVSPDGQARLLEVKSQLPTGAVEGTSYAVQTVRIEKGSKIIVYTDGVTSAERADHEQFGDGRLVQFSAGCAAASASDTVVGLLKAVDEFVDGAEQSDDIAVLAIGL